METSQTETFITSPGSCDREPEQSNFMCWWVAFLCAAVCMLDGYDMVVAPISVPVIAEVWNIEAATFSPALTATVLGIALGAVFIAPLGDRFGRRPLIIGSFSFLGVSSLLTPLATTVFELTLLRLATGLGMGVSLVNALALASEFAVPHLRSRVLTCVYSMSALGGVVGGFVAPPILAAFGWQGLYVVGGALPLLLVPILLFSMPESRRFLEMRKTTQHDTEVDGSKQKGAIDNVRQLLTRYYRARTLMLWTLTFLANFTIYVISSWLPTLMRLYGWSIENSVHALMTFSFGGIVGGFVLGWLVDKGRVKLCLLMGFIASGLAMLALNVVPAEIWIWIVLIAVIGAGMIGVSYAVAALTAIVYPTNLRAGGLGAASAISKVGATMAPMIGGWFLLQGFTVLQILTGLVGPMIVGIVIVLLFAKHFDVDTRFR